LGLHAAPALMSAIKSITAEELYKRALFPFLTKTAFVLEPDGERILEATWMVQELPRRMRAPSVLLVGQGLLVVTNRAIYLLEPTTAAVCNVCEPWKLCPAGPRLMLRVPFYRLKKIVLDFATKYQCGQRMKLVCMQAADEARARTPAATDGFQSLVHGRAAAARNSGWISGWQPQKAVTAQTSQRRAAVLDAARGGRRAAHAHHPPNDGVAPDRGGARHEPAARARRPLIPHEGL